MERAPAFGQGNGNGMGPDAGSLVSHGPASGLHGSPRVNEPAAAEGLPAPPQIEPLVLSTETSSRGVASATATSTARRARPSGEEDGVELYVCGPSSSERDFSLAEVCAVPATARTAPSAVDTPSMAKLPRPGHSRHSPPPSPPSVASCGWQTMTEAQMLDPPLPPQVCLPCQRLKLFLVPFRSRRRSSKQGSPNL